MIVEQGGPNRLSEWSADGKLIRDWVVPQLRANYGIAPDPRAPDQIYMPGQKGWLVRWHVNYQSGQWTPDAVWPNVGTGPFATRSELPHLLYHGDDKYLAFGRNYSIYKFENNNWRPCAAILTEGEGQKTIRYIWRDENGDGQVQDAEYKNSPTIIPKGALSYWGESWMPDFSLVAVADYSADVWRLAPNGFDDKGNPIFAPDGWKKLLTDPNFAARQAGKADALHGGNEVPDSFDASWRMVAPAPDGGYYVDARGGDGGSANFGAQQKLTRYVPDGKGGFQARWRVGRTAAHGTALPGEIYGSIFVSPPINGLVGIIDQSRAGALVYTEDGLYVDTLLADVRSAPRDKIGAYFNGGEFFAGQFYPNEQNGNVYLGMGKTTPVIFQVKGWGVKANPIQPLSVTTPSVTISSSQIAPAPDFALALRGGGAKAKVAAFYPAPGGGPALDGSLTGWEGVLPITFSPGPNQSVEVRPLYDPDTIYLRWHARLGKKFEAKALNPPERIFTHDRAADTLGFYLQADPNAPPGGKAVAGRPGDVRYEFGLFQDGTNVRPVALGLYPKWTGKAKAAPLTYTSPVGKTPFENVTLLPDVKMGYQMDADGQGYVLAAAIPRSALPGNPDIAQGFRSTANFEANFGGNNRFWWANSDGSASAETYDEPTEARLYPGAWAPTTFLPLDKLTIRSWTAIGPFGFPELATWDSRQMREQMIQKFLTTPFAPEKGVDLTATYNDDNTITAQKQRTLKWKTVNMGGDEVDVPSATGFRAGEDAGTIYLATHIYAPVATTVKIETLDEHGQHFIRGWMNGEPLPAAKKQGPRDIRIDPDQPVSLHVGWNELLVRSDVIYGRNELGIRLVAPADELWKLKVSAAVSATATP